MDQNSTFRLTRRAEQLIRRVSEVAMEFGNSCVETTHILLALSEDSHGHLYRILVGAGLNPAKLSNDMQSRLDPGRKEVFFHDLDLSELSVVLKAANIAARSQRKSLIDTEHVLIGMLSSDKDEIVQQHLNKSKLLEALKQQDALSQYGVDLTDQAAQDNLDRVVARNDEIDCLIATFQIRRPKMALLIGESGVGKTSIIHGLAQRIVCGAVPPNLQNSRVILLKLDSVFSSANEHGGVETRIKAIVRSARERPTVLFLDDVDAFVSGHYQELFFRNSDLIKSAINDARLLAVASMTTNVYHEQVVSSEWFRKRFNAIEVKPLQFVDSRDAIRQNLPRIVSHYGIAFDFSAVDEIVLLASRHNHWGCLPGSAFRLLDEIASQIIVNNVEKKNFEELDMAIKNFQQIKEDAVLNQDFEKAAGIRDEVDTIRKIKESIMKSMQAMKATEEVSVDYNLVASEYRNVTGLPNLWSLWGKDRGNSLSTIRVELSNVIKGQEAAVEAVLRVVPHLVSGSQQYGRPFSSLLFAGPSGTGKTLLCELLAKHLLGDVKPIVIDLTAYSREEDVPRLYAKMNELLCNEELIRGLALPRGILVFDHLESAAQEVKTIISSWFRDNWYGAGYDWGKSIGCCLVILMTRGGIPEPLWRSTEPLRELEFERSRVAIRDTITKNIETAFPADLINRLDSIVVFDSFLRCDLLAIFDLLIDDWRACLQEEGISVLIDENARERIVSMSQVPALGARMLGWNVEHFFMRPAAEKVTMSAMASRRRIRIEAREHVFNHLFEISVESANVS